MCECLKAMFGGIMFNVTILGAITAGLLSFLSPCILPIVPFYLSYMAGIGMNQVSAGADISRAVRLRAVISAVCFSLGVITVFVGLGASASLFGGVLRDYFDILRWGRRRSLLQWGCISWVL